MDNKDLPNKLSVFFQSKKVVAKKLNINRSYLHQIITGEKIAGRGVGLILDQWIEEQRKQLCGPEKENQ